LPAQITESQKNIVSDDLSKDRSEPTLLLKLSRNWQPAEWREVNVAVALSGGADSMALLRALSQLKQQAGGSGKLVALHVNHQLRGRDSDQDAAWCQQQCDTLAVPLKVLRCDTAQCAAETGEGIEAAARAGRYQLLTTTAEQLGARFLTTAHTRNDQVETILFRIFRGTGLRGLSGIPRTRFLTPSLTLIRPLLDCSREMLTEYLTAIGQSYRTDRSNDDHRFTRNRLRHELLPLLREQYNPELDSSLLRLASQAAEAQQTLELQAQGLLEAAQSTENAPPKIQTLTLHIRSFADHHKIVVCEALRIAWREAGLAEQAMTYESWNRLASLVEHPREGAILNLPGNVRASIAGEQLLLEW